MSEQMQKRIASLMLALKYFGKLPRPAGKFEQQVVDAVIELGYVEVVDGKYIRRKEGKCAMS